MVHLTHKGFDDLLVMIAKGDMRSASEINGDGNRRADISYSVLAIDEPAAPAHDFYYRVLEPEK